MVAFTECRSNTVSQLPPGIAKVDNRQGKRNFHKYVHAFTAFNRRLFDIDVEYL